MLLGAVVVYALLAMLIAFKADSWRRQLELLRQSTPTEPTGEGPTNGGGQSALADAATIADPSRKQTE